MRGSLSPVQRGRFFREWASLHIPGHRASWGAGGMGLASHPCPVFCLRYLQASWGVGGPPVGVSQRPHLDFVFKTSLENVQGRLLFLQASFCQTQIVSSGKMLGLTNKGKEPQRKVGCCSGPLLRRARGCVSGQEDQERLACADPLGPGRGGAWCFLTLGNEVTQLSPLPYLSSAPVTPGSSSAAGWTLEPRAQNPTPMYLQPSYGTCAILG